MVQSVKLSERLETVAGFIKNNASVIDVGTDHGLLPSFFVFGNERIHKPHYCI